MRKKQSPLQIGNTPIKAFLNVGLIAPPIVLSKRVAHKTKVEQAMGIHNPPKTPRRGANKRSTTLFIRLGQNTVEITEAKPKTSKRSS